MSGYLNPANAPATAGSRASKKYRRAIAMRGAGASAAALTLAPEMICMSSTVRVRKPT